jgi:hypothetical protein
MDEPTLYGDIEPPDEIIAELWRAREELRKEFGDNWPAKCVQVADDDSIPRPITLDDPMHPLNIRRRREAAGIFWKPPGE